MNKKTFDRLSPKPKLLRVNRSLRAVNSAPIDVLGRTTLYFSINGLKMSQNFYVVDTLNKNFILGRDWLKEYGVRLYFDLGMLRIGKTYVKLDDDIHISSILRLNKKVKIEPQTAVICHVKLQKGFQIPDSRLLEVTNLDHGCILDEPGLTIRESVNTVRTPNKVPILIVNETNKCYRLRRGGVVGRARPLTPQEIYAFNEEEPMEIDEPDPVMTYFELLYVPEDKRQEVVKLLKKSKDLIAK